MTCIVGLEHEGVVWMGGDSLATDETTKRAMREEKVFRNGPLLIGTSGSPRYKQVLRYALGVPDPLSDGYDMDYMVNDVVPAIMACLDSAGHLSIEDGIRHTGSDDYYANALIGYNGTLYAIGSDFSVGRCVDGYDAIGSGKKAALGAMYVTTGMLTAGAKLGPRQCIHWALEAAAYIDPSVGEPFVIESV